MFCCVQYGVGQPETQHVNLQVGCFALRDFIQTSAKTKLLSTLEKERNKQSKAISSLGRQISAHTRQLQKLQRHREEGKGAERKDSGGDGGDEDVNRSCQSLLFDVESPLLTSRCQYLITFFPFTRRPQSRQRTTRSGYRSGYQVPRRKSSKGMELCRGFPFTTDVESCFILRHVNPPNAGKQP